MKGKKTEKSTRDLREELPRGAIVNLAAKYDCTHTWIRRVVSGKDAGNEGIIKDAEKLKKIEKKYQAQLQRVYQTAS